MTGVADRIARQVMWERLIATVEEQARTLMRAALSPIVRESGDLSAGVFDLRGRMMAQAVTGTPGHINTMAASVPHFLERFPAETMAPGDVYLTNDPWLGSGHLNDFVLAKPCFLDGVLVGLNACTSHLADIGGRGFGPDAADVHEEGFYVPPIKLVDRGALDETLMTLLRANSRTPAQNEGDVYALIACCEVGEERLVEMMREFRLDSLEELATWIVDASRDATVARIRDWPRGVWRNEMTIDGYDFEVRVAATMTIDGDRLVVDYAGSSGRSRYGVNCPLTYAQAYTVFGVKCVVAPDVPNNAGALEPFVVAAPEGSIVNARKPAPVAMRHIVGQLLPDAVFGCLHEARPGSVPAEGTGVLWDLSLRGGFGHLHDSGGTPFALELVHNGGTGARPDGDGLDATAYPSGVMGSQVEMTESTAPLIVWRRELRPDSGGAGRRRGGHGQIVEIGSSEGAPFQLAAALDRIAFPARGRAGGKDGARGALRLDSGAPLNGKGEQDVPAGDRLRVETPGGGGYGPPADRDPAAVEADLRGGLVTPAAAARDYGPAPGAPSRVPALPGRGRPTRSAGPEARAKGGVARRRNRDAAGGRGLTWGRGNLLMYLDRSGVARRTPPPEPRERSGTMGATRVTVTIRNPAEPERSWEGLFLVDTGATDSLAPGPHLEIWGMGSFMISGKSLRELALPLRVREGEHYVAFEDLDDLRDKLSHYARDDAERERIAKAGGRCSRATTIRSGTARRSGRR